MNRSSDRLPWAARLRANAKTIMCVLAMALFWAFCAGVLFYGWSR